MLKYATRPFTALIAKVPLVGTPEWNAETTGRLFPSMASLLQALDSKSRLILEMLSERQKLVEQESETGLWTLAGLKNQPSLFQGRNQMALIHISNHAALTNVLGPEYGNALLKSVIATLRTLLPTETLLCRERPDKLLVVFPPVTNEDDPENWMRVVKSLFSPVTGPHEITSPVMTTGNAGMVSEEITEVRLNKIILNAGIALHHARQQGNGYIAYFSAAMHEEGLKNVQLHEQLTGAIERQEFRLVMQPIISLHRNEECHEGECLIRWQNPLLGYVPPDQFITLAEETGLMIPLGNWIVENACRELAGFIHRGAPTDFKLHVNVSPVQLFQPDFAQSVLASINRFGLLPENICVEITEGVLLKNTESTMKNITALHTAGVSVALDDFGSGYSSLSYLHNLVFDQLKIDRQFVQDIQHDLRSESVVSSVLMLSHNLNVPLVAEGVETLEMAEKLRQMGCDLVQGYYYGRPKPFGDWPVHEGSFVLSDQ